MTDDPIQVDALLSHGPWLERIAHHLVRDVHAAEDAVQDTWVSALRRPPSAPARTRAWLRTVLTREIFQNHRKGQRRRRHEALADANAEFHPDPAYDAEQEELRAEVASVFRSLPEPYRSTLHLNYFEGLSSTEVAKRLGIPAATVRWRVMTGLERMRVELERKHPDRSLALLLLPLLRRSDPGTGAAREIAGKRVRREAWRRAIRHPAAFVAAMLAVVTFFLTQPSAQEDTLLASAGTRAPAAASSAIDAPLRTVDGLSSTRVALQIPAVPVASAGLTGSGHALFEVEVADASGALRRGAVVSSFRRASEAFEEAGRTDERGRARLVVDAGDLGAWGGKGTAGRVALRASAAGWADSNVVFASPSPESRPVRLVLPAQETVIEGDLVDEQGHPVSGARVEFGYVQANQLSGSAGSDLSLPQPVRAMSDERGRFCARGVDGTLGRVAIHVSHAGFLQEFREQVLDGTSAEGVRIVLRSGGRVRGRVVDLDGGPVASARIWHEPVEQGGDAAMRAPGYVPRLRGWSSMATADADGRFELPAVPLGAQLLWAQSTEQPEEIARAEIDVASTGDTEWNPILENRVPLDLVLDAGANGPKSFVVRLWFRGPGNRRCIREGATDPSGSVRFYDVCGDAIDVSVFAPDTGFLVARTRVDGPSPQPVKMVLSPPAHVLGRILTASGAPFTEGILRVAPSSGLAPWIRLSNQASDGSFEEGIPAGAYDMIVSCGGSNAQIASFDLAPGETHDLGTIQLPALGKLRINAETNPNSPALEYRIVQMSPVLPESVNKRVEVGAWPPPAERELLPGRYLVEAGEFLKKDIRVDRSWNAEIEAGGGVTLNADP